MWNDVSVKPTECRIYHVLLESIYSNGGGWGAVEYINERTTYDPDEDLWDEPGGYTVVKWKE